MVSLLKVLVPFVPLALLSAVLSLQRGPGSPMDHHAHHDMASAAGGSNDMTPMPMFFINTWETILWFKSWETHSITAYAVSLLGLVLLGIAHEALNCYRAFYLSGPVDGPGALQEPLVGVTNPSSHKLIGTRANKLVASALYTLNIITGYLLMLAVMTFNVGYFFAVTLGMGAGYFLLFDVSHRNSLTRGDSCHARHDQLQPMA